MIDLIDPGSQAIFRERVAQAELGARMNIDNIQLIREDGSKVAVELSLSPVIWDKGTAVQVVIRNARST
jgi:hypothetical protein